MILCDDVNLSLNYLEKVKSSLAPEYFDAIKNEIEKREQVKEDDENNNLNNKKINIFNVTEKISFILLFLKDFALNLLEKMKTRHVLLVAVIKSNSKNFLLFCKNLLRIILKKMKIIL